VSPPSAQPSLRCTQRPFPRVSRSRASTTRGDVCRLRPRSEGAKVGRRSRQQSRGGRGLVPWLANSASLVALRTHGPQQVFRISPFLTRFVALWSLAALFVTGMPLLAVTQVVTAPYTLTGNQIIDKKLGDLVDLQAGMTGYGSLLKTGDGVLKLGGTSTFSGDVVVNGGVVVVNGSSQLGAASNMVTVNGVNSPGIWSPGFDGGMLLLDAGTGTLSIAQPLSLNGRGPTANNNTAALMTLGNVTLEGPVQLGNFASTTYLNSAYGNLVIAGPVNLAGSSYVAGNGNTIINGPISGTSTLYKAAPTTLPSTLWLENPGTFVSGTINLSAGYLRLGSAEASGTTLAGGTIQLTSTGLIEVRADIADGTPFSNQVIHLGNTSSSFNGGIFLDRAIFGKGINQIIKFGGVFQPPSSTYPVLSIGGRNGYGFEMGSLGQLINGPGYTTIKNNANGLLSVSGDMNVSTTMTFSGWGDTAWNGSVYNTPSRMWYLFGVSVASRGLTTVTGGSGSSVHMGPLQLSGGILQLGSLNAVNNNTLTGVINITGGGLNYVGAEGEGLNKLITMTGSSPALILANHSGTSGFNVLKGITPTSNGSKVLVLGGESKASNTVYKTIAENGTTSVFKAGSGLWVYAPSPGGSTPSGLVTTAASGLAAGTLVVSDGSGIDVGMSVSGTNVPTGAVVVAVSGNTLWLSTQVATSVPAGTALNFGTFGSFSGSLSISAGTMRLQATSAASDVLSNSSAVVFTSDATAPGFGKQNAGGRLEYLAFGGSSTEVAGSLTATAGAASVALTNGGTLAFAGLGARSSGATVDFQPGLGTLRFNSLNPNNGILGAWATLNGVDFAGTLAGGTLAAATYVPMPTSGGTATANYLLSGGTLTTGSLSANALKVTGSGTLSLGGPLTLTSGGLLFDNSAGAMTIAGGSLAATNSEWIVTANGSVSSNALRIDSLLASGSLTKSGTGVLILSGSNTYTGNTTVNEGTLRLLGTSARIGIPSASSLVTIRQNATLDLNGAGGSGALYNGGPSMVLNTLGVLSGAGRLDNSNAGPAAALFGTSSSMGTAVFSGLLQNSGAPLTVVRNGVSGTQYLTGLNTYTGATILSGSAILAVNTLANGGSAQLHRRLLQRRLQPCLQWRHAQVHWFGFELRPIHPDSLGGDRPPLHARRQRFHRLLRQFWKQRAHHWVQNNATLVFAIPARWLSPAPARAPSPSPVTPPATMRSPLNSLTTVPGALSVNKTGSGQWLLTGANTTRAQRPLAPACSRRRTALVCPPPATSLSTAVSSKATAPLPALSARDRARSNSAPAAAGLLPPRRTQRQPRRHADDGHRRLCRQHPDAQCRQCAGGRGLSKQHQSRDGGADDTGR
jgi:autotransporter-associated beta strand protein